MDFLKIILTVSLMLLSMINYVMAAEIKYKDVPQTHWAFQAIQNLSQLGIVKGFPDKSFKPDQKVTREQFAIVLVNTFKFPLNNMAGQTFSDVGLKHRSFLYIDAAKSFIPANHRTGYNFNFNGDRAITREEVANAVINALDLKKAQKPGQNYLSLKYRDYQSISLKYRNTVALAAYYGIMSGDSGGYFHGKKGLNRAELCVIINNLEQKKLLIEAGLKPARTPWTIEFVNFQRPDYEKVRDHPEYNNTQTFYGEVVSKVYGFNNSHLIVTHKGIKDEDGETRLTQGKTVRIYLTDKDMDLFDEGEWVWFYYDRNNNVTSHKKD